MKNKWLNIILIICMIIMQRVVIQMSDYEVYQLPFASTLFIFDNQTSNLVQILYAYIPLPFVLFYFSGNAREITTGYGKLWLIRSYSRERLYLKKCYIISSEISLYSNRSDDYFFNMWWDMEWFIKYKINTGNSYIFCWSMDIDTITIFTWIIYGCQYFKYICKCFLVVSLIIGIAYW